MRKKIKVLLLCLLVVLICVGCNDTYFEGEICELEYKEAYTTVRIMPITIFNGRTTSVISIPYTYSYPDRWYVVVKNYDDKKHKFITNSCYVTKDCFDSLEIGDWFVFDKNNCFIDEPCVKERAN